MTDPLSLLIWLIVLALVCYLLFFVLNQLAMPQPVRVVIIVIVALVLLVYLLRVTGIYAL
jgi:hypothetical protein